MDCRECREAIAAWLDGVLDREARVAFVSHLASCEGCRAEAEGAARVHARLSAALGANGSVRALVMQTISQRALCPRRMDMVRRQIRGFVVAASAAAVVLAGMFVWMTAGTKAPMSAYAALEEAVRNSQSSEWVHCRSDLKVSGQMVESWESFRPRRVAEKFGNRLSYYDGAQRKRYVYNSGSRTITVEDVPETNAGLAGGAPDYFTAFVAGFDKRKQQGGDVAKSQKTVDGKVYDVYTLPLNDLRTLTAVDPVARRVVWQEYVGADGKTKIHTTFDYPADGPEDIYALGAPRDAEVVTRSVTRIQALHDAVEAAQEAFPRDYFAILYSTLPGHGLTGIDAVYRKGDLYRFEKYHDLRDFLKPQTAPADMAGLEALMKTLRLSAVYICDARLETGKAPLPGATMFTLDEDGRIGKKTPVRWTWRSETVEEKTWPAPSMISPDGMGSAFLLASRAGQNGTLDGTGVYFPSMKALFKEHMPSIYGWFLNPARDYACEEHTRIQYSQDVSVSDAQADIAAPDIAKPAVRYVLESKVTEYAQTPEGRWYPKTTVTTEDYKNSPAKTQTTTMLLDAARDIPDDLFDAAKFEAEHKPVGTQPGE